MEIWEPLGLGTMAVLTGYALFYSAVLMGMAYAMFRRRPL